MRKYSIQIRIGDHVRLRCNIATQGRCYLMQHKKDLIWVRSEIPPVGNRFEFTLVGNKRIVVGEPLKHESHFGLVSSLNSNDLVWYVIFNLNNYLFWIQI
jgi:hypothetical protein